MILNSFCFYFTGNGLACIIVIKLRSKNNLTNTLIFSQACIDLITACVLIAVTSTQIAGSVQVPPPGPAAELYCGLWDSWVVLFACFAMSTFNLVAIAIERFVAVNFPVWYSINFSQSRAVTMAIVAWVLAPTMQIVMSIIQFDYEDGKCDFHEQSPKIKTTVGVFTFLWEYFVPVVIMTVAFVKIAIKLRQQGRKLMAAEASVTADTSAEESAQRKDDATEAQTQKASSAKRLQRVNVTKTLFMVYIIYFICWSPNQIAFLRFNLGGDYDFQGAYHSFSVILAMCNTSVNPFIYALQYKQYRAALKKLLQCKWNS